MEFETPSAYRDAGETVHVFVRINGAAPRPRYRNGSQVWRPEYLRVRWTRHYDTGEWGGWVMNARVVGPWVKKDGTAMDKAEVSESLWHGERDPEAATFLAEVEKTRPTHPAPVMAPIDVEVSA